jgi:hypothetical protein
MTRAPFVILEKNYHITGDLGALGTPLKDSGKSWVKLSISWKVKSNVIPSHGVLEMMWVSSAELISEIQVMYSVVGA